MLLVGYSNVLPLFQLYCNCTKYPQGLFHLILLYNSNSKYHHMWTVLKIYLE